MLQDLTHESFQPYLEQTFTLHVDADVSLSIELIQIDVYDRPQSNQTWGRAAEIAQGRQSFALVFRGPAEPPLPQGMYDVAHPDMGRIPGLGLVPIDQDIQGRYYEAVFT